MRFKGIFSVQFSSVTQPCLIFCDPMDCSMPDFPALHLIPELAQIHIHWVDDAIQPSHPLLFLFSIFPSIRVFFNESVLCRSWPKYWSFNFSLSHSNEYSGLISFRTDWFDLLDVQGTLKSFLQHDSSEASILRLSAFFTVQLSYPYSSVQFSLSVVSDSLWLHEPQHTRPPCPSPTPGVHPNSCPLSQWCHPTILSPVIPFSSCPQSFPASGSFPMSQLFTSGGQSIVVSASTSVFPMKAYMTTLRNIALTSWTFVGKLMSQLLNMLSRFVTVFLLRIKHLLTSWLQSPSAVILESKIIKFITVSILSLPIYHEVMRPNAIIFIV